MVFVFVLFWLRCHFFVFEVVVVSFGFWIRWRFIYSFIVLCMFSTRTYVWISFTAPIPFGHSCAIFSGCCYSISRSSWHPLSSLICLDVSCPSPLYTCTCGLNYAPPLAPTLPSQTYKNTALNVNWQTCFSKKKYYYCYYNQFKIFFHCYLLGKLLCI